MQRDKARVLIIERDESMSRRWLARMIQAGIECRDERTPQAARRLLRGPSQPLLDCVLIEFGCDKRETLELLDDLTRLEPPPRIGVLCERPDNGEVMLLMRRHVSVLFKPIQPLHLLEFVAELRIASGDRELRSVGYRSIKGYADAFGFSEREREVLEHCIAGHGRAECAAALGIGVGSVHRLWGRILARTGNATQDDVLRQLIRHLAEVPVVSRLAS